MDDPCQVCGGDGRIANAFGGSSKSCPSCHGTGRRNQDPLMRDVTKTKASHHRSTNTVERPAKQTWPTTHTGMQLADEVKASGVSEEAKTRLVREIIDYEATHGSCTKTFTRKLRKEIR